MIFKCPCCNKFVQGRPQPAKGFCETAYDEFEWLEIGAPVPPLEESIWLRADKIPEVGERRFLKVSAPFDEILGKRFNVLYSPALSAINGWGYYPEGLSGSAVVGCTYERTVCADEYRAWTEISVERVIPFGELYKHYPRCEVNDVPGERVKLDFRHGCWEYYSYSTQGDWGEWQVVYVDEDGLRHTVLLCEWDMHGGFVYCGNAVWK